MGAESRQPPLGVQRLVPRADPAVARRESRPQRRRLPRTRFDVRQTRRCGPLPPLEKRPPPLHHFKGFFLFFIDPISWIGYTSKADAAAFQLVGLAVISLGNCWRLAGCNDMAIHISMAEHYSIDYTKHCSVCYVVQLYKSILTYSIQLAWNLAMSFDERCSRG